MSENTTSIERDMVMINIMNVLKRWNISHDSTSGNHVFLGFNLGGKNESQSTYEVVVVFYCGYISISLCNRTTNVDHFDFRLSVNPSKVELDKLAQFCENVFGRVEEY